MKVRVICPVKPMRAIEARRFMESFGRRINGMYVFSGKYQKWGKTRDPLYYVVGIPRKDEPISIHYEMYVEKDDLMAQIPSAGERN